MASTTKEQLRENCESIVRDLDKFLDPALYYSEYENEFRIKDDSYDSDDDIGMYGYIQNGAYDIRLTVDMDGTMYGARLMVAGGGPNIYINTLTGEVEGYWGVDECHIPIGYEICKLIDDTIETMRY